MQCRTRNVVGLCWAYYEFYRLEEGNFKKFQPCKCVSIFVLSVLTLIICIMSMSGDYLSGTRTFTNQNVSWIDFRLPPSNGHSLETIDFGKYKAKDQQFLMRWLPVLLQRAKRIGSLCLRRQDQLPNSLPTLMWEMKHQPKAVYCPLYKVASTNWITNFLLLSHFGYSDSRKVTNKSELTKVIKYQNGWSHQTAYKLYKGPNSTLTKLTVLKKAIRFLVVRHPFRRLLSLFKVKIDGPRNKFGRYSRVYKTIKEDILHKYRNSSQSSPFPTFPEFVAYLIKHGDKLKKTNTIFKPQWETCQVCNMDYNLIMKLETFEEDQKFLSIVANYTEVLEAQLPDSVRHQRTSPTSTMEYFSQLSKNQIIAIYELYKPDFELFEYDIDDFLNLVS